MMDEENDELEAAEPTDFGDDGDSVPAETEAVPDEAAAPADADADADANADADAAPTSPEEEPAAESVPEEKTAPAAPEAPAGESKLPSGSNHAEWLRKTSSSQLEVTISAPEKIGTTGIGRSIMAYKVAAPSLNHDAELFRRYSDFEWLQSVLSWRYAGVIMPPLPPKSVSNTGADFLLQRSRLLREWMELVLKNPYLKTDASLHEFLTSTAIGADWDALKKAHLEDAKSLFSERIHCERWREFLKSLDSCDNPDQLLQLLWTSCDKQAVMSKEVSRIIIAVDNRTGTMHERACRHADLTHEMAACWAGAVDPATAAESKGRSSSNAADMDTEAVDALVSQLNESEEFLAMKAVCEQFSEMSSAVSIAATRWQESFAVLGAFIRLIMNDVMQTWKAHTETVGQVSAKLALVVQNLSKSEMAVKRKSEELEKLKEKHGAQEQVVTNCEDALETETKNVASYELEQDCMRKAIVSVEAYSYVEVRSMAMKILMNQLATIAAASFAHSAAAWEDCAAKCRSVQARLESMTVINA